MRVRQKTFHMTMKNISARAFAFVAGGALVFAAYAGTGIRAYAAEWQQAENGDWTYLEDDGSLAAGWQKINGTWYDLDEENGVWNTHPSLDEVSVCHLVENAVNRAGWFDRDIAEDAVLHYRVDSSTSYKYTVVLQKESTPDEIGTTLKTFEVDKKTGKAKDLSTKIVLDLYE